MKLKKAMACMLAGAMVLSMGYGGCSSGGCKRG